jgi:hypothetical protein
MLSSRFGSIFGLLLLANFAISQDVKPKAKPKGLPRVAVVDPKTVPPDYLIQGEYVGDLKEGDTSKPFGAQVVTVPGQTSFDVNLISGGLPGSGSSGKEKIKIKVEIKDGQVAGSNSDYQLSIADKQLIVKGKLEGVLKRIDRTSPTLAKPAPEGAVVLFSKPEDLSNWKDARIEDVSDGKFLACTPGKNIVTNQKFQNFTMHIEFRLAYMPNATGQGRSNSGLYLQNRYECQMLDSFGLKGENNECSGFYQQYSPLVNMCLPPLVWQTYDIEFEAAKYDETDKRIKPAVVTVLHNGVLVHDKVELKGSTGGGQPEKPEPGAFQLQWHGDPLVYRNIWVVEKK